MYSWHSVFFRVKSDCKFSCHSENKSTMFCNAFKIYQKFSWRYAFKAKYLLFNHVLEKISMQVCFKCWKSPCQCFLFQGIRFWIDQINVKILILLTTTCLFVTIKDKAILSLKNVFCIWSLFLSNLVIPEYNNTARNNV